MILYAAYVNGQLVDQVAGETEESALAKLRLDYPELNGQVEFEIIDGNYKPATREVVAESIPENKTNDKPLVVIEASKLEITVNTENFTQEQVEALEEAKKHGMIVAKVKA